ncbi:sacsin N-terminal ATP-binding-like domain-containing protein [Gordonia cholesterolivorans]|uniref:Molecular chaperone Hsp90 n=1 Tax=Gordonia cholesterolivorans TaxID=559625 RepID=A0ABN3H0V1_9ACTN
MPRPETDPADPFGTADLRRSTLQGWLSSPTRLAEDAAAEAELLEIGYRDRLFTELAANAADAASLAGIDGRVAVWADGATVHVANTGAPLTAAGVRSLTALRVSPKSPLIHGGTTVGRFGMGFRATSLAARVTLASRSGSIEFDADRTRGQIRALIDDPDSELDLDRVPAQRLAWPSAAQPAAGFDTEVVLETADEEAAAAIVSAAQHQAPDLLLELEALARIDVAGRSYERRADGDTVVITRDGTEHRRWLIARADTARWLVPIRDGRIRPLSGDALRSPTATDIELTLPARVIADLPLTPDRRELHPDADVEAAAAGYPELAALVPDDQKQAVIPPPALASGRVDAVLREAVRDRLRTARWLQSATGEALSPERAWVLPGLTADLAALLGDVLEPLAHPDVSDRVTASLLVGLGARRLGLADLAELLSGAGGEDTAWWSRLYAALAPMVPDARTAEELGTLPVPRADGRMNVGCRGLFLIEGLDGLDDPPVPSWVPTVDPAAYDPLLDRLGLTRISPAAALALPELIAELDAGPDSDDPAADPDAVTDVVLRILGLPDAGRAPAELGGLELLGADGERWPADELLLPDSPLARVLVDDSPFGTVADSVVETYGPTALRRLGVGWGFTLVRDDAPVAPDHDLPDEERWWEEHEVPPEELIAVRDLDLVDSRQWPAALALLADDPDTASALTGGYTRWWLRRYAEIDGTALRGLRSVDETSLRGLFDPVEVPAAAAGLLAAGEPDDADDAADWLARLADPARTVAPGVAVRAHAALVSAVRSGTFAVDDVEPPRGARTVSGEVSDDPVVVGAPWWTIVVPAGRAVLPAIPPDADSAALLADLLDAPTAAEAYRVIPDQGGESVGPDSADAVRLSAAAGLPAPHRVRLHDDLHVTVTGETDERRRVPLWVDDDGTVHLSRCRERADDEPVP